MKDASYQLIDCGNFEKLERVGAFVIRRPSPQAVWQIAPQNQSLWNKFDAQYIRKSGGDGAWKINNPKIKNPFNVSIAGIQFKLKLTEFGHLGIFPEQAENWALIRDLISTGSSERKIQVLNLFAYTGGSTFACALAGAEVVHVDASKTTVAWARENAALNQCTENPIRWIVEDVKKFIGREVKRGSRYQGIILDPPSYGRGNKNEVWKIETDLIPLMDQLHELLADDYLFVLLSAHSTGYTPIALKNILGSYPKLKTSIAKTGEMLISDVNENIFLPSGAYALFGHS